VRQWTRPPVQLADAIWAYNHAGGVDIYAVDGVDVTSSNHTALQLSLGILTSARDLRPDEFGSPWLSKFPGCVL
jgi:hypothetical protein